MYIFVEENVRNIVKCLRWLFKNGRILGDFNFIVLFIIL